MNCFSQLVQTVVLTVALVFCGQQAFADPPDILRNYRFVPSHSTVHVTGGIAGVDWELQIEGSFGLVTGYNYDVDPATHLPIIVPHAEFIDVRAILYNPLSMAPLPVPGWDLDKTLNLSGLEGTFSLGDPNRLFFRGEDGQGAPIRLEASIRDRLIHIVGANDPHVPGTADFFGYKIDAVGILGHHPDFDLDDDVDGADFVMWQSHFPMADGATHEMGDADGDGDVDGADFIAWQTDFAVASDGGAAIVPEPTAIALALAALALFALYCWPILKQKSLG